ncbi:MAG: MFS transporter [Planctomycetota bacterium]
MIQLLRRNPQFTKLWLAQVISQSGDWLNRVACLALIGRLGGAADHVGVGALFGAELALRLIPSAVLGPLAGPIADRLPRRFLMIAADVLRMAIVISFLFVREPSHLPLLYFLIAAQMGVGIFFDAARTAALPDTVRREELHTAYAISAATWSITLSLASWLGGWIVSWGGVEGAFVIDSLSYLASALCLYGLRLPPVPTHHQPFRWRDVISMTELRRGVAHLRELRITPIVFAKTFWGGAGGFLVILSIAGNEGFGDAAVEATVGAAAVATGALYAARGIGTGFGPILARRFSGSSDRALRRQVSVGFLIAVVGYAFFAPAPSLFLACVCVGFAHMGGSMLWIASTVFWQKHVADAYRGRVFAVEFLCMDVSFAVGGLAAGAIYDASGSLPTTVWIMAAAVAVLGTIWSWLARGVVGPNGPAEGVVTVPHESD